MNQRGAKDREDGERSTAVALSLSVPLERLLRERVRATAPREACGLLLGRREGSMAIVVEAPETHNLAPEAGRYRLDPAGHLLAERRAEERGMVVLGVWHGHPGGDPRPSYRDLCGTPVGWCQLILAGGEFAAGLPGAWRREELGFRALVLRRPAEGASPPPRLQPRPGPDR